MFGAILSALLTVAVLPALSATLYLFSGTASARTLDPKYIWVGVAFSLGVISHDVFLGVAGLFVWGDCHPDVGDEESYSRHQRDERENLNPGERGRHPRPHHP